MASPGLKERVERLESQVAEIRSTLSGDSPSSKNWRRAVEKYAGDEDLLAVLAEAKKLRDAERKKVRQRRPRRSSS